MKRIVPLLMIVVFISPPVAAEGWLDTVKSWLGLESAQDSSSSPAKSAPRLEELVAVLTDRLGVSSKQAEGGVGALLGFAQQALSPQQFQQLTEQLPGVREMITAAPAVSNMSNKGGLDNILDNISEQSDTLKSVNTIRKQFDALGLSPDHIRQYVQQIQQYLDTEQGQQAKALLSKGLRQLGG